MRTMGNQAVGGPGSARARTAIQDRRDLWDPLDLWDLWDLWVLWVLWVLWAPVRQENSPTGRSLPARGCRTPYGTFVC